MEQQMIKKTPAVNQILRDMDSRGKIPWETYTQNDRTVLFDIMTCHSAEHGFSSSTCPNCGTITIHYGSCHNSCCPSCGQVQREQWIDAQKEKVINAPAFHVTFTVPDKYLFDLFRAEPEFMYDAMFKAVEKALKTLAADPKYLGAEKIGFFSTLHTWGSTLIFHPHIHVLMYGAGITKDGKLAVSKEEYLFPVKRLAYEFKKEFLSIVGDKFEVSNSPWLHDIQSARKMKWNVEIREKHNNPQTVMDYLGRYMGRVAISNGRIISHENEKVTFTYKDYKNGGKMRQMTLDEMDFLKRFMYHIPPSGFRRTRYYGFLSTNGKKALEKIKALTKTTFQFTPRTREEILRDLNIPTYPVCSTCKNTEGLVEVSCYPRKHKKTEQEKAAEQKRKESNARKMPKKTGARYNRLLKWVLNGHSVIEYTMMINELADKIIGEYDNAIIF